MLFVIFANKILSPPYHIKQDCLKKRELYFVTFEIYYDEIIKIENYLYKKRQYYTLYDN